MKLGFVYKWHNSKNGMVYIGRHQGSPDDGYIASSPDFLEAYNSNKKDWTREILFAGDYQLVKKHETLEIKRAVELYGSNCLFNKCSSTKEKTIKTMSQGALYKLLKDIDTEIKEYKNHIAQLEIKRAEILLEKQKFSNRKIKKDV